MHKKTIPKIAIAVVLLLIGFIYIASLPAANIKITQTDMEQAAKTNGGLITRDLTISKGDTFTLNLFAAGYAGMRWSGNSDKVEVVRQDGAREFNDPFPFGGRNGEKWTFKAVNAGHATISMSYQSVGIFDTPPPIVNTLKIQVTVTD
jgi:predicted secreted protein